MKNFTKEKTIFLFDVKSNNNIFVDFDFQFFLTFRVSELDIFLKDIYIFNKTLLLKLLILVYSLWYICYTAPETVGTRFDILYYKILHIYKKFRIKEGLVSGQNS